MLDLFHLPENPLGQQFFQATAGSSLTTNDWQIWQKPKGCVFIYMFYAGGGGGGGAGFGNTAGNARGGGGGGAGGNMVKIFMPAVFVPDRLYIQVGKGGAGGIGTTAGGTPTAATAGIATVITVSPNLSGGSPEMYQRQAGGALGNAGTNSNASAGGAAGTNTVGAIQAVGILSSTSASAGTSGGNPTTGAAPTVGAFGTNTLFFGGLGGGGLTTSNTEQAGAAWPADSSLCPNLLSLPIPGGVVTGGRGNDGIFLSSPLIALGGTGGGSNASGIGGFGGAGVMASGGGGGGAGTTGGNGGNGGDGFCLIIAM